MGQDTASQIDQALPYPKLLEAARHHTLRAHTKKDLQRLVPLLEGACETARIAAINALQDPAARDDDREKTDPNFGFAELFAALRRTRAELLAREFGRTKRVSSSLSNRAQSVSQSGAPGLARQKARH